MTYPNNLTFIFAISGGNDLPDAPAEASQSAETGSHYAD